MGALRDTNTFEPEPTCISSLDRVHRGSSNLDFLPPARLEHLSGSNLQYHPAAECKKAVETRLGRTCCSIHGQRQIPRENMAMIREGAPATRALESTYSHNEGI